MGIGTKQHQEVQIDQQTVSITSLDKPLWPKHNIQKVHYLQYLTGIAPYMLPFLENRTLTVIRFPHGVDAKSFYQKNCPDYAPDFIQTFSTDGINYIICSDRPTLIWLGNQVALEFHVPFQTIQSACPTEIVFDLDPPSRNHFHLAIEAALMIKDLLDGLGLMSYIKTSGNKGLQIYIPLPDNQYSYEDTRKFTQSVARYLTSKEPNWFTIERFKVNRGEKLYVDYLQHAQGKTIIAPYSTRGNEEALVATPLDWNEINRDLRPEHYHVSVIKKRLEQRGCPWHDFFKNKKKQKFKQVLRGLQEQLQ